MLYTIGARFPVVARLPRPLQFLIRRSLVEIPARLNRARCSRTTVVGVTGSMGKTTTTHLLTTILAATGSTVTNRRDDNGLGGVPATIRAIRLSDRFAVVEAGIFDQPGEMRWMAGLMRPEVAILTGIGEDHSSAYGSRERVALEKRALLERLGRDGTAVVNSDDELARRMARGISCRVVLAGSSPDADVRVVSAKLAWPDGLDLQLAIREQLLQARVPLHATHLAPLAALAVAAAEACGIPAPRAVEAITTFEPPHGRMNLVDGPNGSRFLMDDYKSRIANAVLAVRALGEAPAQRRIAVLGEAQECIHTAATYAPVAAALPACADILISVGRSGPPFTELLRGTPLAGCHTSVDTVDAAVSALADLREGDLVLVHGATRQHLKRIKLILDGIDVGCRVRRCTFPQPCPDCRFLSSEPPARNIEAR